ncbi:MAG: hypothetical protein NC820_07075 [Candidatus Omnitrophica bacterium]|nr:hypothetical protein [Candidatus Omnitrophota bacterium]
MADYEVGVVLKAIDNFSSAFDNFKKKAEENNKTISNMEKMMKQMQTGQLKF